MPLRYGLCCLWDNKRTYHIRRPTLARLKRESPDPLHWRRAAALYTYTNLQVVFDLIRQCGEVGWNLRLSQGVTPLFSHPDIGSTLAQTELYPAIQSLLETFTLPANVRLSMHPSAYCRLASPNLKTVLTSAAEINLAAELLDLFGVTKPYERPINVHIGTVEPDLDAVMRRFKRNMEQYLTPSAQRKLVVENDDKGPWTVMNIWRHGWHGPITLDFLHERINPSPDRPQFVLGLAMASWDVHGVRPQFHWSESAPGSNPRAHALMPGVGLPQGVRGLDIDLDVELKGKSDAIKRLEQFDKEYRQSLAEISGILNDSARQPAPASSSTEASCR